MIIYISMLLLSLLFCALFNKMKDKKVCMLFAILSSLMFILVSSIRYDVGTDYLYRYVYDFNTFLSGKDVSNLEIGFKLLIKLCILITKSPQLLFIITSTFINGFIFYTIYTKSVNKYISITLFFTGAFFFQSLNMVRQYMAIVLLFSSYKMFLKENWFKLSLMVILALMLHTTSIIVVLGYLFILIINKIFKINLAQKEKIILLTLVLVLLFGPYIRQLVNFVLSFTRFDVYIGSQYDYGDLQIIPFVMNLIVYFIMLYVIKKKKTVTKEDEFFLNMQLIALVLVALGNTMFLAIRMVYYFSIFQIISIPYFLKCLNTKKTKKIYNLLTVFIILMYSTSLIWTHVLHTSDEVLPYKTVFNKEYEFK